VNMKANNNMREAKSNRGLKLFRINWSQDVTEHGYSIVEAENMDDALDKFREEVGEEIIETREIKDFRVDEVVEKK